MGILISYLFKFSQKFRLKSIFLTFKLNNGLSCTAPLSGLSRFLQLNFFFHTNNQKLKTRNWTKM